MSLFDPYKKARKRAKKEAAQQSYLGARISEEAKERQAGQRAAEQSRLGVFGMLGAPGTYELPGTAGAGSTAPAATKDLYQSGTEDTKREKVGQLKQEKYLTPEQKEFFKGERKGLLDPEKYKEAIGKTASFRIQSRLTAESEQLLARQGPMYDMLENSTLGAISQQSAIGLRDLNRKLKNNAAKGGTARRSALNEALQMRQAEDIQRTKVEQTWRANIDLFRTIRNNAQQVQQSNQSFMNSLPLVRDDYQEMMTNLSDNVTGAIALNADLSQRAYENRAAIPDSNVAGKIIGGVLAIGLSMMGAPMAGAAAQSMFDSPQMTPGASVGGVANTNPDAAGQEWDNIMAAGSKAADWTGEKISDAGNWIGDQFRPAPPAAGTQAIQGPGPMNPGNELA